MHRPHRKLTPHLVREARAILQTKRMNFPALAKLLRIAPADIIDLIDALGQARKDDNGSPISQAGERRASTHGPRRGPRTPPRKGKGG